MNSTAITAVTPVFKKLQKWRIEHGRDPKTGRVVTRDKKTVGKLDAQQLIWLALKFSAGMTTNDDLKPQYEELAEIFEDG